MIIFIFYAIYCFHKSLPIKHRQGIEAEKHIFFHLQIRFAFCGVRVSDTHSFYVVIHRMHTIHTFNTNTLHISFIR